MLLWELNVLWELKIVIHTALCWNITSFTLCYMNKGTTLYRIKCRRLLLSTGWKGVRAHCFSASVQKIIKFNRRKCPAKQSRAINRTNPISASSDCETRANWKAVSRACDYRFRRNCVVSKGGVTYRCKMCRDEADIVQGGPVDDEK